jgi:hypothetical protein
MGRKAALYASFGIRDLWVIDAVRLTTRVLREPAADGYRDARDFGAADRQKSSSRVTGAWERQNGDFVPQSAEHNSGSPRKIVTGKPVERESLERRVNPPPLMPAS